MSSTQPPTPTAQPDRNARYSAILDDLIERAAALARHVHERATAATPTLENRPDADPTIAFDRIARTVRRCIVLARHIAAHPIAIQPTAKTAAHPSRSTARAQLIRGVEDAIHRKRPESEAAGLYAELNERLEDPDLDQDLDTRPIAEVIEELSRDLGVAVQGRSYIWKRRTPQDVAALRRRAAGPANLHLIQGGRPPPEQQDCKGKPAPAARPHAPS